MGTGADGIKYPKAEKRQSRDHQCQDQQHQQQRHGLMKKLMKNNVGDDKSRGRFRLQTKQRQLKATFNITKKSLSSTSTNPTSISSTSDSFQPEIPTETALDEEEDDNHDNKANANEAGDPINKNKANPTKSSRSSSTTSSFCRFTRQLYSAFVNIVQNQKAAEAAKVSAGRRRQAGHPKGAATTPVIRANSGSSESNCLDTTRQDARSDGRGGGSGILGDCCLALISGGGQEKQVDPRRVNIHQNHQCQQQRHAFKAGQHSSSSLAIRNRRSWLAHHQYPHDTCELTSNRSSEHGTSASMKTATRQSATPTVSCSPKESLNLSAAHASAEADQLPRQFSLENSNTTGNGQAQLALHSGPQLSLQNEVPDHQARLSINNNSQGAHNGSWSRATSSGSPSKQSLGRVSTKRQQSDRMRDLLERLDQMAVSLAEQSDSHHPNKTSSDLFYLEHNWTAFVDLEQETNTTNKPIGARVSPQSFSSCNEQEPFNSTNKTNMQQNQKQKLSSNLRTQQDAIWELIFTENSYIRCLRQIIEVFVFSLLDLQQNSLLLEVIIPSTIE